MERGFWGVTGGKDKTGKEKKQTRELLCCPVPHGLGLGLGTTPSSLQAGDCLEDRSNCSDTFPVSANTPGTHATRQEGDAAQLAEWGHCALKRTARCCLSALCWR